MLLENALLLAVLLGSLLVCLKIGSYYQEVLLSPNMTGIASSKEGVQKRVQNLGHYLKRVNAQSRVQELIVMYAFIYTFQVDINIAVRELVSCLFASLVCNMMLLIMSHKHATNISGKDIAGYKDIILNLFNSFKTVNIDVNNLHIKKLNNLIGIQIVVLALTYFT